MTRTLVFRCLFYKVLKRLLGESGGGTETSSHPTVIEEIQTASDQAVGKAIPAPFFRTAVVHAVHHNVFEPHVLNAFATRIIYCRLIALVAMFVKNKFEKCFLDRPTWKKNARPRQKLLRNPDPPLHVTA